MKVPWTTLAVPWFAEPAADAVAAGPAAAIAAEGLVVGEDRVDDGQRTAGLVEDRRRPRASLPVPPADHVVGQDAVGHDLSLPRLSIPPPCTAKPCEMVSPAIVTFAPGLTMSKTRLVSLPLTVRFAAPSPSISRLLLMASSPLVSVIVWPARERRTRCCPRYERQATVARSDPAPCRGCSRR